jgi:UDP-hydrolysing UDP-N-acetyl-D-glucosamine 2-epimerase
VIKITFATSSRSDFGLIRPIINYMFQRDAIAVELACLGSASWLEANYLQSGIGPFHISRFEPSTGNQNLEGSRQTVAALSRLCESFSDWLASHSTPTDWLFVPGDRFEIFAAAIAGYYNNCPIAHIFGGDRSEGGHLDDNVRHAITKLAHVHFAVCEDSRQRLLNLGEEHWRVYNVGSPVVESVQEVLDRYEFDIGQLMQPRKYNVLCTYNPITTESEDAGRQFGSILRAFDIVEKNFDVAFVITYPNNEYGSKLIIDELEGIKERSNYFVFKDLGWKDYLATLAHCNLVVGNSSSGMLEAPILGVPTLDIGTRQRGRYAPPSVHHVEDYDPARIATKIEELLLTGERGVSHPYGDGNTSEKIYEVLTRITREKSKKDILQKKITY